MMLTLGLFVFQLDSAPYTEFKRQLAWRHATQARVGAAPELQFIGRDTDVVSLSGTLMPELTGGTVSLALLETMADMGKSWPLIEGTGLVLGLYVVTAVETTRTLFFKDGAARRIDFVLTIKRTDNDDVDTVGTISDTLLGIAGLS